ncbi:MAG TPA: dihydrofolate reductase family protein [Phototrophicaceae bacterium]|nr:dihydrofolate reductase family protein [Phototrophicaceae bacterium]
MGKVIVSTFISLDGYINGPNGDTNWFLGDPEMQQYGADTLAAAAALLLGRRTYELFLAYWPQATGDSADRLNRLPKVVFSRTLERVEWGSWPAPHLVKDHIPAAVAALRQQYAGDLVIFAGAGIVKAFHELDLIDEYRLLIHPLVLGGGTPLFQGWTPLKLKLLREDHFPNGVTILRYTKE